MKTEIRAAVLFNNTAPGKLGGYAAVFDSESMDLGGFTETVRPGAFTRSLKQPDAIMAYLEHDRQKVLGRMGAGTLQLVEDARGLSFTIDLPDTTVGRDLEALVARRDIAGASFAFTVPEGGERWTEHAGRPHRELLDVNLMEITITATPAYMDTSVAKRHLAGNTTDNRLQLARLYLETL